MGRPPVGLLGDRGTAEPTGFPTVDARTRWEDIVRPVVGQSLSTAVAGAMLADTVGSPSEIVWACGMGGGEMVVLILSRVVRLKLTDYPVRNLG